MGARLPALCNEDIAHSDRSRWSDLGRWCLDGNCVVVSVRLRSLSRPAGERTPPQRLLHSPLCQHLAPCDPERACQVYRRNKSSSLEEVVVYDTETSSREPAEGGVRSLAEPIARGQKSAVPRLAYSIKTSSGLSLTFFFPKPRNHHSRLDYI